MLSGIWRYPVKSMAGERLDRGEVSRRGLAGDRSWAVVDVETGMVGSAKHPRRWARLLACRAWLMDDGHHVGLELPDGRTVSSHDRSMADDALSRLLDRPVVLRSADSITGREIERTDPLVEEEPATGPLELDEVVAFELGGAAAGSLFDFASIHVVTGSTLGALTDELGAQPDEIRARLRPNLVVDLANEPFAENDWPDGALVIGETRYPVVVPTPRCIVPTLPQRDLGSKPELSRVLARLNRAEIPGFGRLPAAGAYLSPRLRAPVRLGDPVTAPSSLLG